MQNCETCGRLISAPRGVTQCLACRQAARAPKPEVLPETPLVSERDIPDKAAPEEISYKRDESCVRCRKHHAMVDSEFCLACQLELLSLLGDAAHDMFQTPQPPPKPPVSSAVSLMNDVEEKRDRTATSRIRVVGAAKLK